jgi:hypothetical protein
MLCYNLRFYLIIINVTRRKKNENNDLKRGVINKIMKMWILKIFKSDENERKLSLRSVDTS